LGWSSRGPAVTASRTLFTFASCVCATSLTRSMLLRMRRGCGQDWPRGQGGSGALAPSAKTSRIAGHVPARAAGWSRQGEVEGAGEFGPGAGVVAAVQEVQQDHPLAGGVMGLVERPARGAGVCVRRSAAVPGARGPGSPRTAGGAACAGAAQAGAGSSGSGRAPSSCLARDLRAEAAGNRRTSGHADWLAHRQR
jgi:hypothetical protein